jgi:D-inositol-3-phosphate glycosyltransferase
MISAHSCPVGELGGRDTGGMSVYIRELAGELSRQGHTVDVYTRIHDPKDPIVVSLGERARLIHLAVGEPAHIDKLAVYPLLPDFTCGLERYRKDHGNEYDIVFSHYWLSGWVGDYLRRWWSVPHVTMFHTLGALKNASGYGFDDTELRIVTEQEIIERCQRVIVATEREKRDIAEHYGAAPETIGVVHCGVNMELFRPLDRAEARTRLGFGDEKALLFVGRIDPVKGVDRLVQALPLVKGIDNLKLIVIGGDEASAGEVEKLRALAAGLGVGSSVSFRGAVNQSDLAVYYNAADATVIPSYYESFGLVGLESLACGTPLVAADVGCLKDIVIPGKTGLVVADNSPERLAEGITRVLAGPPASREFVRESVKDYSWESVAGGVVKQLRYTLCKQRELIA